MSLPSATVVVVTRNRQHSLRRALRSALAQDARPEVVVIDDASADGTAGVVRREFPGVRLHVSAAPRGVIVQRNAGARLASGEVVFSLDDDAVFASDRVVGQTLRDFDDARVGAVALPLRDLAYGGRFFGGAPDPTRIWLGATFFGTAHAVRRSLFLALGGFREILFHQGEEADFALRMLATGHVVRLGRSEPVVHFGSEGGYRDCGRSDRFGRRNELLTTWLNVPTRWLPVYLVGFTVKGVWRGVRVGRPRAMVAGLCMGLQACRRHARERAPVDARTFALDRALRHAVRVGRPLELRPMTTAPAGIAVS